MITPETYAQYKRDGYIALPEFLSPSELDYLKERYTDVYEKQNAEGKTHNVVAVASGSTTMQNLQIHYMGLLDDGISVCFLSRGSGNRRCMGLLRTGIRTTPILN